MPRESYRFLTQLLQGAVDSLFMQVRVPITSDDDLHCVSRILGLMFSPAVVLRGDAEHREREKACPVRTPAHLSRDQVLELVALDARGKMALNAAYACAVLGA